MVLLILGVIVFILGSSLLKADSKIAAIGKPMKITGLVLILVGALSSSVRQVDAGFVGVKALFGKVQNETMSSGLSMINPLMSVTDIDIRTQNYTMSGVHDEGVKSGDDAIKVLTADGLEVTIDLSVLYRVNPLEAPNLLKEIGINFEDKIVRPITRTRIRDNSVYYDAVALYSTKRDEFQSRIFKTIEIDFKQRGLILENLLVRNITLPASVKSTIEQKINAEQEAQKMQFVLQKEKQEAERKRVEAQGISDYQRILTSTLTDKLLQYERIKAQKELAQNHDSICMRT
jgi:regulator of protease activity HflC (stomatin/prohibitin superfamily)